jgi:hypothetical protein
VEQTCSESRRSGVLCGNGGTAKEASAAPEPAAPAPTGRVERPKMPFMRRGGGQEGGRRALPARGDVEARQGGGTPWRVRQHMRGAPPGIAAQPNGSACAQARVSRPSHAAPTSGALSQQRKAAGCGGRLIATYHAIDTSARRMASSSARLTHAPLADQEVRGEQLAPDPAAAARAAAACASLLLPSAGSDGVAFSLPLRTKVHAGGPCSSKKASHV